MKLHLHIGSHKAGSTAIQWTARNNQGALGEAGLLYPAGLLARNKDQHSGLAGLVREDRHNELDAFFQEIEVAARRRGLSKILLSGEGLCTLDAGQVRYLWGWMDRYEVRVHYIVRSWRGYIMSQLKQHLVHAKRAFDLTRFLAVMRSHNYDRIIRHWEDTAGSDMVQVWGYDALKDNLLERFFAELGVQLSDMARGKSRNKSADLGFSIFLNSLRETLSVKQINEISAAYHDIYSEGCGENPFYYDLVDLLYDMSNPAFEHPKIKDLGLDRPLDRRPEEINASILTEKRVALFEKTQEMLSG